MSSLCATFKQSFEAMGGYGAGLDTTCFRPHHCGSKAGSIYDVEAQMEQGRPILKQWLDVPGRRVPVAAFGFAALFAMLAVPVVSSASQPLTMLLSTVVLAVMLAILSAIDLYYQRLPDVLTLPLTIAGLALAVVYHPRDISLHVAAAIVAYGVIYAIAAGYQWLRGKPGLGMGDAKLFAAAGAWLGMEGLPSVLLLATGAALSAIVLASLLGRQTSMATRIPLGPFLAFGFWIVWLYGPID